MITLGIIGVVAALTLPTLINNQQEKVLESQYKKSRNIVSNGYMLMMSKNEIFKVDNLPIWDCYDLECVSKEHKSVFSIVKDSASGLTADELPKGYKTNKQKTISSIWENTDYIFATSDGMVYGLTPESFGTGSINSFTLLADVNGVKNPNTVKKDLYKFRVANNGKVSDITDDFEKDCSVENPAGCTTPEACYAADECNGCYDTLIKGTYWSGGSCHVTSCACPT